MALYRMEYEESLLASHRQAGTLECRFTTKAFRMRCNNLERADGSCNPYIMFTEVRLEDMKKVDRALKSLPKMCCLYDAREEVLIVNFMLGFGHHFALNQFYVTFLEKLIGLGLQWEIVSAGCTTYGDERSRKEADNSFKPISTRPNDDDWPSLVLEVAFSKPVVQSLAQLRLDAHFWLTRSQMQTNIVILIHIDMGQRQLEIERWEATNPRRPRRTTGQYSPTPSCVQRIVLGEQNVYSGPPLEFPVEKVFDIVPPNIAAGALHLTAPDLQLWNDHFWRAR